VLSEPALSAPRVNVQGLVLGDENARYDKGFSTLDLQQQRGAVQVRWLGFDHNSLLFGIGFYNNSPEPANIGIEDIRAEANGTPVRVFSVQELAHQAKNRAMWSQIGLAFVGAAGSALAASQRNTYYSTMRT